MMELCDKVQLIQQEIQRLLEKKGRLIVAIDGRCGSGKSTLAAALQEQYGYPVVHMDDFFLRSEQRTAERLATPGENVDHERFLAEVLSPLAAVSAAATASASWLFRASDMLGISAQSVSSQVKSKIT